MTRYTKRKRQEIVENFARQHNGQYDPVLFLREVEETGERHPAYHWFEFNKDAAAREHNLWQARQFTRDLHISFQVEEVGRAGMMTIRTMEMPMMLSPAHDRGGRSGGGGYWLVDPDNPDHQIELCRAAGVALLSWLDRYQASISYVGFDAKAIEQIAETMKTAQANPVASARPALTRRR